MRLLEVQDVMKTYGRRCVVNRVSFYLDEGEIVGLLGPNGAGKTTTFLMAVGRVRPDSGAVRFKGNDVTRMPMFKRARLGLGYLSQERSDFQKLTVEDNILAILETQPIRRADRARRLDELLEELDLVNLRKNRAYTLSGGERRRLEITRALASKPDLILLDEPFAGVDPIAVAETQEIVRSLKKRNISVLLTDHNVRETLSITDRSYIIAEGRIIKQGNPRDLVDDPTVRRVYLGENFSMFDQALPPVSEEAQFEDRETVEEQPPAPEAATEGTDDSSDTKDAGPLYRQIQEEATSAEQQSASEKKGPGSKKGKTPKKKNTSKKKSPRTPKRKPPEEPPAS